MTEGFGLAAIGALYASVVAAVVIAVLDTDYGRELGEDLEAPVRAMIATPVLVLAAVVFAASVLALLLPEHQKRLLGVAGIAGWLIPATLIIAGVLIATVAVALDSIR
jgi:hypothetical protein